MGKLPLGKLLFGKMYIWEVATWEIAHLRSCHLGNCHLGSRPWEKAFGKEPNTSIITPIPPPSPPPDVCNSLNLHRIVLICKPGLFMGILGSSLYTLQPTNPPNLPPSLVFHFFFPPPLLLTFFTILFPFPLNFFFKNFFSTPTLPPSLILDSLKTIYLSQPLLPITKILSLFFYRTPLPLPLF